jgi:hypothetical protein
MMAKLLVLVACIALSRVEHDGVKYGPGEVAGARFECLPEQADALEAVGAVALAEGYVNVAAVALVQAGTGVDAAADAAAALAEAQAERDAALVELEALRAQAAMAATATGEVATATAPAPAAKKR